MIPGRAVRAGLLASLIACSGDASAPPVPARLSVTTPPSASVANRQVLPEQPVVQVTDVGGRAVAHAGAQVTVALTAGAGTLEGTTTVTTGPAGDARFTDLSIAGSVGPKTLTFSSASLASARADVTTVAGAPASASVNGGDGQSEAEGIAVPVPPSVKVADADGNGVPGQTVTFAVTAGGGALSGGTPTTDPSGVATVGAWLLGSAGPNTLTASLPGTGLSPVVFTATALRLPVATVEIAALAGPVVAGDSVRLVATARDSVGRPLASRAFVWVSDDEATAAVSSTGYVTGILPGRASIRATSEGKTGTRPVDVVAPTLVQVDNGFTGHLSMAVNRGLPEPGFEYGYSWYSSVHALFDEPTAGTQLGWGTWVIPNNRTFTQPLCPLGTVARTYWPERGPTYSEVYQTLEGGMGRWIATQFPTRYAKFRVNAVPDCYDHQIASTGWDFNDLPLPDEKLGLAQLANRLLVPAEGLTFSLQAPQAFVGYGWIALPLISAYTSPAGVPTGNQTWTLFLNSSNFSGPVTFLTPETWSRVNAVDPTGVGRGHDARPAEAGSVALEVGITPMFTSSDANGVRYRRIPRILFPADAGGQSVLMRDIRYYSKQAIWDPVGSWLNGGMAPGQFDPAGVYQPTLDWSNFGTKIGGTAVTPDPDFTAGVVQTASGPAFGMAWAGAMEPGVFAEYFRETGSTWTPVAASEVPRETWLVDQTFRPAPRGVYPDLNTSAGSPWASTFWRAGPFTAALNDGSFVDYVWYKFVEQPAIRRLGLSAGELQDLQALVEDLHASYGTSGPTIPPPTGGALAMIDPALIVSPPSGLEVGYVPIIIRQR